MRDAAVRRLSDPYRRRRDTGRCPGDVLRHARRRARGPGVRARRRGPGSRSTPMALALRRARTLAVHVVHDERCGGVRRPRPRARRARRRSLLCTSGTAAANFHPAVVEAGLSDGPDDRADGRPATRAARRRRAADHRPDPPVRPVGRAGSTTPACPTPPPRATWRSLGARAFAAAAPGSRAPQPAVPRAARRRVRDRCRPAAPIATSAAAAGRDRPVATERRRPPASGARA